jgi:hypothetical protein
VPFANRQEQLRGLVPVRAGHGVTGLVYLLHLAASGETDWRADLQFHAVLRSVPVHASNKRLRHLQAQLRQRA